MSISEEMWRMSIVCFAIVIYFIFSICLTFLNNNVIKAYPYPLSITFTHLLFKFCFSWFFRGFSTKFKNKRNIELSWKDYIIQVSPTGIASALDIGLSNWSFEFITISLYTMTKSTSIIFILIFAVIFKLEKLSIPIIAIVLSISVGLFMFTYESTQFDLRGFILVLVASALSGVRWTAAQKVSQNPAYGLSNPIDLIYHTQPWMASILLPLAFVFEGDAFLTSPFLFRSQDYLSILRITGCFVFGSCLAFGLEISEFLVVCYSSSLTLSITGILKEVVTLYLAAAVNGDVYSPLNIAGLVICLAGICLHIAVKFFKHRREKKNSNSQSIKLETLLPLNQDAESEGTLLSLDVDRCLS
ncbi:unnamed protein product [Hymenolepis diminuta]|uniref:Sugar phosphate transporter domain-containing protein n=1 Tax=Hymenolepis diminuta TaxID=6216 RepID=A0A564ZD60_HYMDI|nr:unnamed protein product [Hymenolepis diminuta]